MSGSTQTVGELFDFAIELERSTEALYRRFADVFSPYPAVMLFWKNYANEEKGHAAYLEQVRKGISVEHLSQQADIHIVEKVRHCLHAAAQARVKAIETLDDAYQLASELENSETNVVLEFIIENFSTEELAKSRPFLRIQLSTHINRLKNEFPQPYASATTRQSVLPLSQPSGMLITE